MSTYSLEGKDADRLHIHTFYSVARTADRGPDLEVVCGDSALYAKEEPGLRAAADE
jgi:hypothetical protein